MRGGRTDGCPVECVLRHARVGRTLTRGPLPGPGESTWRGSTMRDENRGRGTNPHPGPLPLQGRGCRHGVCCAQRITEQGDVGRRGALMAYRRGVFEWAGRHEAHSNERGVAPGCRDGGARPVVPPCFSAAMVAADSLGAGNGAQSCTPISRRELRVQARGWFSPAWRRACSRWRGSLGWGRRATRPGRRLCAFLLWD